MNYYKDDSVKIYNADSRNLDFIENNSIEMCITSPPYNVGISYDYWNDSLSEEEYWNFTGKWIAEVFKKLVDGGRIAINIPVMGNNPELKKSEKYLMHLPQYLEILKDVGFNLREMITWLKTKEGNMDIFAGGNTAWGSFCSPSNPYCRSFTEFIIVAHKNSPYLRGDKNKIDITKQEFMKFTKNIWHMWPESNRSHPATFPKELPYRLMKLYTYQNNTVIDPFAGSGTTGLVAKELKRKAILVDISKNYCELAAIKCKQEWL